MAYARSNLGWSADQWQRLNKAVQDTAAQARIVRPLLPIVGGGGYISGVPDHTIPAAAAGLGLPAPSVGGYAFPAPTGLPRLHVPPTPQLLPVELSCELFVPPEQLGDEDTVTSLAMRAANLVAQAEDAVLINGGAALGTLPAGVLERNLTAQTVGLTSYIGALGPIATPTVLGSVILGIAALRGLFFTSPFCVIVDPASYAAADTPVGNATVGTTDQIRARMRGGDFVDSPVLPANTGIIFSLGGRPIDLTVSVDAQVELLNDERGALLRVVEQFVLRVKDPNAIAVLP